MPTAAGSYLASQYLSKYVVALGWQLATASLCTKRQSNVISAAAVSLSLVVTAS